MGSSTSQYSLCNAKITCVMPQTNITIVSHAYNGYTHFPTVYTIPTRITQVNDYAFAFTNIQDLVINHACGPTINAFNYMRNLKNLYIYQNFNNSLNLSRSTITPECVLHILNKVLDNSTSEYINNLQFPLYLRGFCTHRKIKSINNIYELNNDGSINILEAFNQKG